MKKIALMLACMVGAQISWADENIDRMQNPIIAHLEQQFEQASTDFTSRWVREGFFWNCTEYLVEPFKEINRSQYLLFRREAGMYKSTASASRVKTFMHNRDEGMMGVGVVRETVHRCEISGEHFELPDRVEMMSETIRFINQNEMIIRTIRRDERYIYENSLSCTLVEQKVEEELESYSVCVRGNKG